MKMSSLLDIGCLFFLILVICCIAANGYIRYFLILITAIYYLTGSGMLGYVLAKPLLTENTDIKLCQNTSGIILLGSGLNNAFGNIEPGIGAYERIIKTAQIYHMYPQKIIISGGQTSALNISEAQVYAEQLYKLGIPKSAMLLEDKSKNTYQNAKFTKELINNDSGTYCLVTGGIHYTRAKILFNKFDINTISIASSKLLPQVEILPSAYNFYMTQQIIHEYLGVVRAYL